MLGKQTNKNTEHVRKADRRRGKIYANERYIEFEFKQIKYQGED
jgi:hypothetical protein